MKKVSKEHYRRITLLFIISFLLINVKSFGKESVWVRPYEIKFNYEAGSNNDAITIKNGNNTYVPVPEWKYNGGNAISEKIAYIEGQVGRGIMVSFDSNCTTSMHLLIKLTTVSGTSIGNKCNYFITNYTPRSFVPIYLEGSVPDKVGKRDFTWKWEIYAIPNDIVTYCAAASPPINTSHTYYTLLSAPVAPMAEPWISVLDKACTWAADQLTGTTIANKITEGIYYMGDMDGDIDYDWPNGANKFSTGNDHRHFKLTTFLESIATKTDVLVNCSDVANLFSIFSSSVGLNSVTERLIKNIDPYAFNTNPINPI